MVCNNMEAVKGQMQYSPVGKQQLQVWKKNSET